MFKFGKTRARSSAARDAAPSILDSRVPADAPEIRARAPGGWFDSSQDLKQGLEVVELDAAEWPFEAPPAAR